MKRSGISCLSFEAVFYDLGNSDGSFYGWEERIMLPEGSLHNLQLIANFGLVLYLFIVVI